MPDGQSLAPCIAFIGPASAGKSTILHQLDEKLGILDSVLVIQGTPDGVGRYMYHSPEFRHDPEFKKSVKGKWGATTVDHVCQSVICGRRNLSLALLDFGGLHDERTKAGNARMLATCSHYLVVSRDDDPAGAALWDEVGHSHNLIRLGWMRSFPAGGKPPSILSAKDGLEATFQVDIGPGNPINDLSVSTLSRILENLAVPANKAHYVNLHFPADWSAGDVPGVRGHAEKIRELAGRTGVVVLGGKAPIWAYLAGLKCALDTNPQARVFFYDPRQPDRLIEIPPAPGAGPSDFPADLLQVSWSANGDRAVLQFEVTASDKLLPPVAAQNLAGAPAPPAAPVTNIRVGLSGRWPTWLFGTYARWLIASGVKHLGSYDLRLKAFVDVW